MTDYLTNDTDLKKVADAIRAKGGTTAPLVFPDGFSAAVGAIQTGGGTVTVNGPAITFIDYDGTLVTKWAIADLADKTELPTPPSHDGLTFQGWNWTLEDIKALTQEMVVGPMYITDDGKTRLYIHLEDGRTSPMLGCCPNGTVTVDWGDGTTPDTLTGTSTSTVKWTPTHAYAAAGDYVITLQVEGSVGFEGDYNGSWLLRHTLNSNNINIPYQNAIRKVELGSRVTNIGNYAFRGCYSLASITIASGVTSINTGAFQYCYSLAFITIPSSVMSIKTQAFSGCYSLAFIALPSSVTSINTQAFYRCCSLASITIPSGVTSIDYGAFNECYSLASITIPSGVTSIGHYAFSDCNSLASITIPSGVTSIGHYAFSDCNSLASITIPSGATSIGTREFYRCFSLASIFIPSGVTNISDEAFASCCGMKYYDFTALTAVPTLANTNAFSGIAADCEIRVPASLVDEWKAAENWSTYADHIVGV